MILYDKTESVNSISSYTAVSGSIRADVPVDARRRREEREGEVRNRIVKCSFELFAQYGIKSISMDYLAQHMGMSKRTLYSIFRNKEDLLMAGILYYHQNIQSLIQQISGLPDSVLDKLLKFYFHLIQQPYCCSQKFYEDLNYYGNALNLLESQLDNYAGYYVNILNQGVTEGLFNAGQNLEIIALYIKEQLKMTSPMLQNKSYSVKEICHSVFFIFLRGICTDKGRTIITAYMAKAPAVNLNGSR